MGKKGKKAARKQKALRRKQKKAQRRHEHKSYYKQAKKAKRDAVVYSAAAKPSTFPEVELKVESEYIGRKGAAMGTSHPATETPIHAERRTVLPDFIDNRTTRVYPLPEIVGRGWKIVNDNMAAGVDFDKKLIYAPLDDDDVSHCCKMQQVARIKWDDPSIHSEDTLLFRALEDHRLNYLMAERAQIDIGAGFLTPESIMLLMQHFDSTTGRLSVMLMTDYTKAAPTAEMLASPDEATSLFKQVRDRIRANPTKANTVAVIKWLRVRLQDAPTPDWMKRKMPPFGGLGKGKGNNGIDGNSFEELFEIAWDELDEDDKLIDIPSAVREQLPKDLPETLASRIHGNVNGPAPLVPWGVMRLEEPHRNQSVFGKFHRKWKPTEEGVFPRYPHRFFVDQRIFGRRYKIPGGTVVIDSSGSMGLTPEAIKTIVEYAPGCVVANYSGNGNGGVLRILAKGTMRVANSLCCAPNGGGNIVDFPALKWAYKQSHPRIWVSDLGVTGVDDQPGVGNLAMCAAAVKKGRFFHASHLNEAIAVLKKLGRYYKK